MKAIDKWLTTFKNSGNIFSMNIPWEMYQKIIPDKQKEDIDVKTDVEHYMYIHSYDYD